MKESRPRSGLFSQLTLRDNRSNSAVSALTVPIPAKFIVKEIPISVGLFLAQVRMQRKNTHVLKKTLFSNLVIYMLQRIFYILFILVLFLYFVSLGSLSTS